MNLDTIAAELTDRIKDEAPLGGTLKFAVKDAGVIYVNGADGKNVVSRADDAADCTILIAAKDIEALLAGKLQPAAAYMSGKLKIEGDLALAMHLSQLI